MTVLGTKISTYPDGGSPRASDEFVIARGGANYKVAGSEFGAGWQSVTEVWTRTGNHTFTAPGDLTARYQKGVFVRYKDGGGFEYGVIASSTYAAPSTTVTLITNSDYEMAAAIITDTAISRSALPVGFPDWFNWTPVQVGFSADPAGGVYRWRISGREISCTIRQPADGTSNATGFTLSAPVACATITDASWQGTALSRDNGVTATAANRIIIFLTAPTVLTAYSDFSSAAWTATGAKRIITGSISYEF